MPSKEYQQQVTRRAYLTLPREQVCCSNVEGEDLINLVRHNIGKTAFRMLKINAGQ